MHWKSYRISDSAYKWGFWLLHREGSDLKIEQPRKSYRLILESIDLTLPQHFMKTTWRESYVKGENSRHSNQHQWRHSRRKVRQGQKVKLTINLISPLKILYIRTETNIKTHFLFFFLGLSNSKLEDLDCFMPQITVIHLQCNQCSTQASSPLKTQVYSISKVPSFTCHYLHDWRYVERVMYYLPITMWCF